MELGGPVPQHNIRGAWKQQGVVTKSTWRQWKKEKSTSLLKSNEKKEKICKTKNCLFQIKVTIV